MSPLSSAGGQLPTPRSKRHAGDRAAVVELDVLPRRQVVTHGESAVVAGDQVAAVGAEGDRC